MKPRILVFVAIWKTSLNWGFYVNIPLIYTFHLTPSAELYKFDDQNATDMLIAFKFIVPLSRFDLYAGFVPGLTAVTDVTAPHALDTFRLSQRRFPMNRHDYVHKSDQSA